MFDLLFHRNMDNKWTKGRVVSHAENELHALGFIASGNCLIRHNRVYAKLEFDQPPYSDKPSRKYNVEMLFGRPTETINDSNIDNFDPYGTYWGLDLATVCGRRGSYIFQPDQNWERTTLCADLCGPAIEFLKATEDLQLFVDGLIAGKLNVGKHSFNLTPKLPITRFQYVSIISAIALALSCGDAQLAAKGYDALRSYVAANPNEKETVREMLAADDALREYQQQ